MVNMVVNNASSKVAYLAPCEKTIRLAKVLPPTVDMSIEHLLGKFPVVKETYLQYLTVPDPLAQKNYDAVIMATIHGACIDCVRGRSHESLLGCHKNFNEKLIDAERLQEKNREEIMSIFGNLDNL